MDSHPASHYDLALLCHLPFYLLKYKFFFGKVLMIDQYYFFHLLHIPSASFNFDLRAPLMSTKK